MTDTPLNYFVDFFPVPYGADPGDLWQEIEERVFDTHYSVDWYERRLSEAERAKMRVLTTRLMSWRPTLAEDTENEFPSVELTDKDLQVEFRIYDDLTVRVALPYVRDRAVEVMEFVMECLEMLAHDGYSAHDSELDRIVTRADLNAMVDRYRALPDLAAQRHARRRGRS